MLTYVVSKKILDTRLTFGDTYRYKVLSAKTNLDLGACVDVSIVKNELTFLNESNGSSKVAPFDNKGPKILEIINNSILTKDGSVLTVYDVVLDTKDNLIKMVVYDPFYLCYCLMCVIQSESKTGDLVARLDPFTVLEIDRLIKKQNALVDNLKVKDIVNYITISKPNRLYYVFKTLFQKRKKGQIYPSKIN